MELSSVNRETYNMYEYKDHGVPRKKKGPSWMHAYLSLHGCYIDQDLTYHELLGEGPAAGGRGRRRDGRHGHGRAGSPPADEIGRNRSERGGGHASWPTCGLGVGLGCCALLGSKKLQTSNSLGISAK